MNRPKKLDLKNLISWGGSKNPAFFTLQETSLNFPVKSKALRAGSHCGGRVICRRSDPPQAENPVKQDSFLYIYRDTKMMKNLDKIRGEDERENNQSSEYKCCCQCRFTRNGIDHDRSGNWI